VPGEIDFEKDGIPRAFDCNLDAATFLHIRGDDRNPDKNRAISAIVPAFLKLNELTIQPVTLPAEAVQPGLRSFVEEAYLQQAERGITAAKATLETARKQFAESDAAAKLAALIPDEPADALSVFGGAVLHRDDFAAGKLDAWEIRAGEWKHID